MPLPIFLVVYYYYWQSKWSRTAWDDFRILFHSFPLFLASIHAFMHVTNHHPAHRAHKEIHFVTEITVTCNSFHSTNFLFWFSRWNNFTWLQWQVATNTCWWHKCFSNQIDWQPGYGNRVIPEVKIPNWNEPTKNEVRKLNKQWVNQTPITK